MARFISRPHGGLLFLVWNHSSSFAKVGTHVLRPTSQGLRQRLPVAKEDYSLLLTSEDRLARTAVELAARGLVSIAEVRTDDVLRLPFQTNRYACRVWTVEQCRSWLAPAQESGTPESAPAPVLAANPNLREVPPAEPSEAPPTREEATVPVEADTVVEESPEAPPVEPEVAPPAPEVRVVDGELLATINWAALDPLDDTVKRDTLREWGKAFDPPAVGVARADLASQLLRYKAALGL